MDFVFFIHSSTLCLLIGELKPLILRVIIENVCKLPIFSYFAAYILHYDFSLSYEFIFFLESLGCEYSFLKFCLVTFFLVNSNLFIKIFFHLFYILITISPHPLFNMSFFRLFVTLKASFLSNSGRHLLSTISRLAVVLFRT